MQELLTTQYTLVNFTDYEYGSTIGIADVGKGVPHESTAYLYLKACEHFGEDNVILINLNYGQCKPSYITFNEACEIIKPKHSLEFKPDDFNASLIGGDINTTLQHVLDVYKTKVTQYGLNAPIHLLKSITKQSRDFIENGGYHPILSNIPPDCIDNILESAPLFNMSNEDIIEAMNQDGYGDIIDKYNMCKARYQVLS
jgi:hypothetical protein